MSKPKIEKYLDKIIDQTQLVNYLFGRDYVNADQANASYPEFANKQNRNTFALEYQLWYTKASLVVKNFLPDRFEEFKNMYMTDEKRAAPTRLNYTIKDFLNENYFTNKETCTQLALNSLQTQIAIFVGAREIILSNISDLKSLLQFEIFGNEIDAAETLIKHNYLRASGSICGVILERHLRNLCNNKNIVISKTNPCINDLTDLLYKNNAIDLTNKKLLTYLSDIRNKCDHDKGVEPKNEEIVDLINGTKKIISIS